MAVTVLGSSNLDHVYRVEVIPSPGETVLATGFDTHPGGKGLNQAVAAARAGRDTSFVTCLGRDEVADTLLALLDAENLTTIARRVDGRSGTAIITVDESAENTIVVDSGANAELVRLRDAEQEAIEAADVLLMQLEVPLETVLQAARIAREAGVVVVLNAAPIRPLPTELLELLDVLIVNEHEADALADDLGIDAASPEELAVALTSAVPAVIVTLGGAGSVVAGSADDGLLVAAHSVEAVDTTGAGDTYCGAFVASLAEALAAGPDGGAGQGGRDGNARRERVTDAGFLREHVGFASAAAAVSVTREGAATSTPSRAEIHSQLAAG